MNPLNSETSGMQLPPPVVEQAPGELSPEAAPNNVEQAPRPAGAEQASRAASPATAVPAIPLPMPPLGQPAADQGAVGRTTHSNVPAVADDNDLIEKEWVHKAKQIVGRTRDDPYKQTEELTEIKVNYMKKRYGKTIKLSK